MTQRARRRNNLGESLAPRIKGLEPAPGSVVAQRRIGIAAEPPATALAGTRAFFAARHLHNRRKDA